MKTTLRSFSIGILTATFLLGITYLLQDDQDSDSSDKLTVDRATNFLEEEGFKVVDNQEWITLNETVESQKNQQKEDTTTEEENQKDTETNDSTNTTDKEENNNENEAKPENSSPISIEIETGMTTYDVAALLSNSKLIEDETEFINYLEEHDYSRYIQIGTFEIKQGMSHYEIAEVITN
jgi:hypothetical protein